MGFDVHQEGNGNLRVERLTFSSNSPSFVTVEGGNFAIQLLSSRVSNLGLLD